MAKDTNAPEKPEAPPVEDEAKARRRAAIERTAARLAREIWDRTYVKDGVRYVREK